MIVFLFVLYRVCVCVCVCDVCRLGGGSVPYSTLQLLSLSATDADTLVKKFQFKGKPILGLHSNQRVLVVVFRKRVLVIDSSSLAMRFYIKSELCLLLHGGKEH